MDFAACANDYEYALALQQEEDRRAAAARARTSSGVHTGGGAASAGASMPASSSSRAHVAVGEWYTEEEDEEYGGTADDRAIAEALQQQLASFPDQRTASEQRDYQLALMLQAAEAAQLQGSTSTPASSSRGRKRGAPLGDTSAGAGSHKQQRRAASSHASGSRHAPAAASPHASGDGPGTPSCVYVESEVAGGPPAPPRGNLAFQLLKVEQLRAGVRGEDTTSSNSANRPPVAVRLTDLIRPGIEYAVAAVLTPQARQRSNNHANLTTCTHGRFAFVMLFATTWNSLLVQCPHLLECKDGVLAYGGNAEVSALLVRWQHPRSVHH